jgi:ACS family glucarate transporter-like MFS transporter
VNPILVEQSQKASKAKQIVALLWGFAFLSYLLRVNITVAQQFMAKELGLSDIQIGSIFTAFLIGYTVFQMPAGLLGDIFGPRRVLMASALCWSVTTFSTGWVPGQLLRSAALALASLLVLRFIHGVAEASTYPVAMSAVAEVFGSAQHAFVNSIIFTGSTMGAAFAPPLIAYLMSFIGWRESFYLTAILPLVISILWFARTKSLRSRTQTHRKSAKSTHSWRRLFFRPDLFCLCLSYLLYCYAISIFVYWLFKYLVDVRHLSVIGSGWSASSPWIAATIAVPIFGNISMRRSRRKGVLSARRSIAIGCQLVAAVLMGFGVNAASIGTALVSISLSVALLFSTESSYFATAIALAPEDAGGASGLMNFAGNLGGILATSLVPVLVKYVGWPLALESGSAFVVAATLLWLPIRAVHHGQEIA